MNWIRKIIAKSGYQIIRHSAYRMMRENPFFTQKELFRMTPPVHLIFDVGAFNGSISLNYHRMFPNARIFSIEPFPESFDALKKRTKDVEQITPFNYACSDITGKAKFSSNSFSQTNSLLRTESSAFDIWKGESLKTKEEIEVETVTLDSLALSQSVDQIDILKLDVQGAELKVLNGAKDLLSKGKIHLIYTEIITLPTYEGQPHIADVLSYMDANGFDLFNTYNHSYTDKGQLRQVDALFIKKGHFFNADKQNTNQ